MRTYDPPVVTTPDHAPGTAVYGFPFDVVGPTRAGKYAVVALISTVDGPMCQDLAAARAFAAELSLKFPKGFVLEEKADGQDP